MAWVNKEFTHMCRRPNSVTAGFDIRAGDKWQCDVCGIIHTVSRVDKPVLFDKDMEPLIVWRD